MFAKLKSQVFIDTVTMELVAPASSLLRAVLKDERGSICKTTETNLSAASKFTWGGLNDLPYGVYTLELTNGQDAESYRMVKRI
jgi:hypothetical protein